MKLTSSKLKDIIREVLSEQPTVSSGEDERTLSTQEFQQRLKTNYEDVSRINDMTPEEKGRLLNTFEKLLDVFDEEGSQASGGNVAPKHDDLDATADEFTSKTQTTTIRPT